jgi:hypothetical protein
MAAAQFPASMHPFYQCLAAAGHLDSQQENAAGIYFSITNSKAFNFVQCQKNGAQYGLSTDLYLMGDR